MAIYQIAKTKKFQRQYDKLPIEAKDAVDAAIIDLVKGKPYPNGLRVSKMQGQKKAIYEASPTMATRITFEFDNPDYIILRNVGPHDLTLKNP